MPDFGETYSEEGFHRQRRNLMVGCVVLLLINAADMHIRTEATALGLPFHIGRPDVLHWALMCAVVYWAVRFYQYQQGSQRAAFNIATWDLIRDYLRPHAFECMVPGASTLERPAIPAGGRVELRPHDFAVYGYSWRGMPASVNPAWFVYKPGDQSPQIINTGDRKILFRGWIVWKALAYAYIRASVRTPVFTEHQLPYVLFVVTMAFALARLLSQ